MNLKAWYPVISISSVVVMFIWAFLEGNWSHCWISVMIGGIVMAIISALGKKIG